MDDLNELSRPLRDAYYKTVRSIADEALADFPGDANAIARTDFIEESVDGSEWVIYTYRNRVVALVSEFSDHGLEEANEQENCGHVEAVRAYYAMVADVNRLIEALQATA